MQSLFHRSALGVLIGSLGLLNISALAQRSPSVLTRVEQIRHLSREDARRHLPVHIHGVILSDVPTPNFVVKDQSGGVYVHGSAEFADSHRLGNVVDVDGVTEEGFAPIVRESRARVVGTGPLPKGKFYPASALQNGQLDSQWVRTRGVVQSATIDNTSWQERALNLNVAGSDGNFEVLVPLFGERPNPSIYINREVSIEGICGSLSNAAHQFIGAIFYVPRLRFIEVLGEMQPTPMTSLLQFAPDQDSSERTSVTGVVSYQLPGNMVFLQDNDSGLRVQTDQAPKLAAGDVVQVTGFPSMGESKPILQYGILRVIGHGQAPIPKELTVTPPFERFDGVLVRSEAKLLQKADSTDSLSLTLESQGFTFNAIVRGPEHVSLAQTLPLGATVSVTGVCLVRNGGVWHTPASFTILVPDATKVSVVAQPPWWNRRHATWSLLILLFAFAGVSIWIMLLRGRLARQVALYRRKLHSGAVVEERARIARELHDSLEQDLAGIILQLDLAADCFDEAKTVARKALNDAREMTRRGMMEARRSVWDMRCDLLEQGNLPYALRRMVEALNQREQGLVTLSCTEVSARLPKAAELNLLRIAQEAATNSLKHAKATSIKLILREESSHIFLRIQDNGAGFNPKSGHFDGHFGLIDMRERAMAVGSELKIVSDASFGTSIEVAFPLNGVSLP